MHIRSLLLGSAVLAGMSSIAFAAADTGSGGGGGTVDLATALTILNPAIDTDWNKGGQPDLDRLKSLTGNAELKRADVVAAAPELTRDTAPKKDAAKVDDVELDENVDPPDADAPPPWATALMDGMNALHARIAAVEDDRASGRVTAREVLDGPLANTQRKLDPNDPDSAARPYAAPTSAAQAPEGSSAGVATIRQDYAGIEPGRKIADRKTPIDAVKDVEMVAVAAGYYNGLKAVGQRFAFTGRPGSWMIRADDPELPLFISGAKDQDDARAKWGLSIG